MSCDICGRGSCCPSFHSPADQKRFGDVVEAFEKARAMRQKVIKQLDAEAREAEKVEQEFYDMLIA
jgi:hypothetical protein